MNACSTYGCTNQCAVQNGKEMKRCIVCLEKNRQAVAKYSQTKKLKKNDGTSTLTNTEIIDHLTIETRPDGTRIETQYTKINIDTLVNTSTTQSREIVLIQQNDVTRSDISIKPPSISPEAAAYANNTRLFEFKYKEKEDEAILFYKSCYDWCERQKWTEPTPDKLAYWELNKMTTQWKKIASNLDIDPYYPRVNRERVDNFMYSFLRKTPKELPRKHRDPQQEMKKRRRDILKNWKKQEQERQKTT